MLARMGKRWLRAISMGITLGASFHALAEEQPTLKSLNLTCHDFKHNEDGSWSPVHTVTITTVVIGPTVSFNPGLAFNGVDIAALLNKECKRP